MDGVVKYVRNEGFVVIRGAGATVVQGCSKRGGGAIKNSYQYRLLVSAHQQC